MYVCRTHKNALQSDFSTILKKSTNVSFSTDVFTETVYTKDHYMTFLKHDVVLYIYITVIIVVILLTFLKTFGFFTLALRASTNLHNTMFSKLLEVPIGFFVKNPSGRVLNRFSKDLGAIDEMLPQNSCFTFQIFLNFLGSLVMILISNYFMILPILLIGGCLFKLHNWYVTVGKNVQDLESIGKLFSILSKKLILFFSQITSVVSYKQHFSWIINNKSIAS